MKSPIQVLMQWFVIVAICLPARADEPIVGLLRLKNGDVVSGAFADSQSASVIRWQHPDFVSPFEFPVAAVAGASFSGTSQEVPAVGSVCLELVAGDRLYGSIVGIDEERIRLKSDELGELSVSRSSIMSLVRWQNGKAVSFIGPGKLADWTIGGNEQSWHQSGGRIRSDKFGAIMFRNVDLSPRSRIDIELSWENQPNFVLALGVLNNEQKSATENALRLEVWGEQVVAVWEVGKIADVAVVGTVDEMNEHLRMTIELDKVWKTAVVASQQGKTLATLKLNTKDSLWLGEGILLQNIAGNVQLDSLQVSSLDERDKTNSGQTKQPAKDSFHMTNQEILTGQWTAIRDGDWILTDEETEREIDPNDINRIDFATSNVDSFDSNTKIQLVTKWGYRMTGSLTSVQDSSIKFRPDCLDAEVAIAIEQLRSIEVVGVEVSRDTAQGLAIARLEIGETRIRGRLVDADDSAPLRFEPIEGSAVAMLPSLSGRMIYRDPVPPTKPPAPNRVRHQVIAPPAGIWGAVSRAFGNNAQTTAKSPKSLYLRTGEVIPCEVSAIDNEGVVFTSEMTKQTRLPHDQVLAIQLVAGLKEPAIDAIERERLLTVPRNRKKNPPTHLIVSSSGDIMRGKLIRMSEETIEVESRLETIQIDRNLVSQILWLDDRSLVTDDGPKPSGNSDAIHVQALLHNGNRMSFRPEGKSEGKLFGENALLGKCSVPVTDIDQLLIGREVEVETGKSAYGTWKLSDAPEPVLLNDAGGGMTPGTVSALVGTDAPDFTLNLLSGRRFTLSHHKGKIVVLDFWATWCGPCLQAMPVIDETVASFKNDDIVLVAVNLQETEDAIRRTLERLKINPKVALDIDGVAASRYQADAIPQTVIINRDGKIARLLVGGGSKLGEQISDAIQECLTDQ